MTTAEPLTAVEPLTTVEPLTAVQSEAPPEPRPHAARVTLVALTPEARAALGGSQLAIFAFPFRVGRESRAARWTGARVVSERRNPGSRPRNDLYLPDGEEPLNVSREHFRIERDGAGFALVDRRSTCGTLVEGALVGGQTHGGRVPLGDGGETSHNWPLPPPRQAWRRGAWLARGHGAGRASHEPVDVGAGRSARPPIHAPAPGADRRNVGLQELTPGATPGAPSR